MPKISKRDFLKSAAAAALAPVMMSTPRPASAAASGSKPPNVVLICTDDIGYGDLSCYGSTINAGLADRVLRHSIRGAYRSGIHTPNLDRMAREGALFYHFTASGSVCSPSRAGLLTGLYPAKTGVIGVLFPKDQTGLPKSTMTIADMLKPLGYTSMCVGKWHLGSTAEYLPTNRGFDEFYGLPYSHDMAPLTLLHNTDLIEEPADLTTLTQRYTEQAVAFISKMKSSPFFLYFAPFSPHIPIVVSKQFQGRSGQGAYGDAIQEIDWSVGQILSALQNNDIDSDTLVIFTNDHGPWYQGSSANLRGRKGETFEGGVRVPLIARFPGRIPSGLTSHELASNLDIFPTIAAICGAQLPPGYTDGINIWPLLTGEQLSMSRDALLYFDNWSIQCARLSVWKLHVARYNSVPWGPLPAVGRLNLPLPKPELYRLDLDPGERRDVADSNPEIVSAILAHIQALLPTLPDQVRNDWNYTMSLKVQGMPSGALPTLMG